MNNLFVWRKQQYNLQAHCHNINSYFALYNNELYIPKVGWKDYYNKILQALHHSILDIFIFLHIQYGCFFVIDQVIACKKEYRKNSQEGKKTQILVMYAQNEFSTIKHPESCFLVGLNKDNKTN